jgi:VWFA-related protein
VRAQAVVEVPGGERLDRVELFLDDTLLATLYQPPFVQELVPPSGLPLSYVRAVAHLASGAAAEDLAFLAAPSGMDVVDVNFVELYTTVLDRRGNPIEGLGMADFEVNEQGRPQQLLRCEWVENLPIHAAVTLDVSISMVEELAEVERAALRFFEQLVTPRDRAAVMTFADRPNLAVPFTNDRSVLAGGLAGLAAEGHTALYDSVIYALWYFSGIKGKRVLVLLSDGEDSASRYRFEDALDYARRSGVAIYAIGLGLPTGADVARLALRRLAEETGGRAFFVSRGSNLDEVYHTIESELRAQYLLAYQSDGTEPGFREVKVKVDRPGAEATTMRGYIP